MLRLYTDESPGLKVDPMVILFLSLGFIFSVVALHRKYHANFQDADSTLERKLILHQSLQRSQRDSLRLLGRTYRWTIAWEKQKRGRRHILYNTNKWLRLKQQGYPRFPGPDMSTRQLHISP